LPTIVAQAGMTIPSIILTGIIRIGLLR
jgi:hypothetical protein